MTVGPQRCGGKSQSKKRIGRRGDVFDSAQLRREPNGIRWKKKSGPFERRIWLIKPRCLWPVFFALGTRKLLNVCKLWNDYVPHLNWRGRLVRRWNNQSTGPLSLAAVSTMETWKEHMAFRHNRVLWQQQQQQRAAVTVNHVRTNIISVSRGAWLEYRSFSIRIDFKTSRQQCGMWCKNIRRNGIHQPDETSDGEVTYYKQNVMNAHLDVSDSRHPDWTIAIFVFDGRLARRNPIATDGRRARKIRIRKWISKANDRPIEATVAPFFLLFYFILFSSLEIV